MSRLELLTLDRNRLVRLPPQIARLTRLTALSVRENALENLPARLGRLLLLRSLHIDDNPSLEVRYYLPCAWTSFP